MKMLPIAFATLAFAVTTAPVVTATPAQAAANPNVALCKDLTANDPDLSNLSVGQCVSLFTVEDNYFIKGTGNSHAVAVKFCKAYETVYPDDFDINWGSREACVADIESSI